jgi:hypothetical protein
MSGPEDPTLEDESPDTEKIPPVTEEGSGSEENADPPRAQWQFKNEFGIHTKLKEVVRGTIEVSNAELDLLRRKLDKLTYGSLLIWLVPLGSL